MASYPESDESNPVYPAERREVLDPSFPPPPPPGETEERPPIFPPWGGGEILLAVFLAYFFWPSLVYEGLRLSGFLHWYYQGQFGDLARAGADLGRSRGNLWALALAFPLQVATFLVVFCLMGRARPADLGLTSRRAGRNLLAGVLLWLCLTPGVLGVHLVVFNLFQRWWSTSIREHPFARLAESGLAPFEWFLVVFAATVAAPVLEELLFRGVLQPWFARSWWGGRLAMLIAALLALLLGKAVKGSVWDALMPFLFVVALVPMFAVVWLRSRTPVPAAIFGTAALFAAVHSSIWPTPIPLFVLGLGLGLLAARSRSLVGPVVVHGLFNSVACVLLLVQHFSKAGTA